MECERYRSNWKCERTDAEEAKLFYRVQVHWNIFLRHDIMRLLPKIGNYEFDILCVLSPIFVDSNYDVVGFRVISSELSSQVRDIFVAEGQN